MNTMSRLNNSAFGDELLLRVAAGRLEVAIQSAVALGSAVKSLPTEASPQSARSIQATENLVRHVAVEFGMLSSTDVGDRIGSSSRHSRNLASARHRAGELLAITRGNRLVYPGFQFTPDGSPRPAIRSLRRLSEAHDWSEFDLLLWLVTPSSRLDDVRPVDLMVASDDAEGVLTRAAELDMATEW